MMPALATPTACNLGPMSNRTAPGRLEQQQVLYQGRIFSLTIDRVTLPAGHLVELEVVRHPGSVVLLPIPDPGRVILIRQYRWSIDQWIWELPAGSLKAGEEPSAAAARECEEEIGLVPGKVERLRSYYPTPGFCNEEMIFFRCTELAAPTAESIVRGDEDEDLEPRTFTLTEARGMVDSGAIVDMKTVVGLTLL